MKGTRESSSEVSYGYPQSIQAIGYPAYVLIPGSPRRRRGRRSRDCGTCSACKYLVPLLSILSLAAVGFLLFPRQPDVDVKRITLEKIKLHVVDNDSSLIPSVQLDVSLNLLLNITNSNFFGVDYDNISVQFSYRGDDLGMVVSKGGEIPSRSVVSATARLILLGSEILEHATDLIADAANREIPLETVTMFSGAVDMFLFKPQIKVKVYCSMLVDPVDKVVLDKDCHLL